MTKGDHLLVNLRLKINISLKIEFFEKAFVQRCYKCNSSRPHAAQFFLNVFFKRILTFWCCHRQLLRQRHWHSKNQTNAHISPCNASKPPFDGNLINNIDHFANVLKTCFVCLLAEGQRYCSLGWTRQGDDNVAVCHKMSHHVMKQEVDEPYLI